jgi:hypothetical protein
MIKLDHRFELALEFPAGLRTKKFFGLGSEGDANLKSQFYAYLHHAVFNLLDAYPANSDLGAKGRLAQPE